MQTRYDILKQLGVRNITAFNNRQINQELESSLNIPIPAKMYAIVAIIDEFADLMMASSSDLETPIARIAQMARAVGIHLILATQRPSREVITGLIKANFPTRIAFKVASRINSQIILDDVGAESLLGNGDMLFYRELYYGKKTGCCYRNGPCILFWHGCRDILPTASIGKEWSYLQIRTNYL